MAAASDPPRKSFLGTLLKWTLGSIAALLIGLVIIAAVFEQQIASLVIRTLNKQLKTELQVEGASLSLIRQFPQAAVYLNGTRLQGAGDQEKPLLDVGSISLKCSIMGLLVGDYNFTSIAINDGTLYVYIDEKGNANYDIFNNSEEEEEPTDENSDLQLSISDATLGNVVLKYVDQRSAYDVQLNVSSAYFEGAFIINNELNLNQHTLTSYAEVVSDHITIGETSYFVGSNLAYDGAINLDLTNEAYTINQFKFFVQGNRFELDGSVKKTDDGRLYDLTFNSSEAMLSSLLQLVPAPYNATVGQFESTGRLSFDARINGIQNKRKDPIVEVNFGLKKGYLTHPLLDGRLRDVNFEVNFTNGNGVDDQTALLELIDFKASLNNQPLNLNWEMQGLKNPEINLAFDGNIPLDAVYGFFGETVTEGSGFIRIKQLSLGGRLKDMTSMYRIPRVALGGHVVFDQAHLLVNSIPTTLETGQLLLQNNAFTASNVILKTEKSDLVFNGEFQNLLPVLLSDSLNSQNAKLRFQASLNAQKVDLNELLALSGGHSEEEIEDAAPIEQDSLNKKSNQQRERLTSFLEGTFITNIQQITYNELEGQNFNGEVAFRNSIMLLKGVQVTSMDGVFELNGKIFFEKEPRIALFVDCDNIDMQQFLAQTNNFGQEAITAENIRGRLKALVQINLFLDSLGNFKNEDLYVVADVSLKNGELINVKLFEGFSSFIKMRDLRHIVFTELNNQFKIENGQFVMPAMFLQSNALNLVIGGTYNFNHDMDFRLKINAGQVFANKFKRYNPDKVAIKARKNGLINIYARIWGNLYGDYQYKVGPRHAKAFLEEQLNRNLPALTNTLRAEFAAGAGARQAQAVKTLEQPEQWDDIPEYEGEEQPLEYLDFD